MFLFRFMGVTPFFLRPLSFSETHGRSEDFENHMFVNIILFVAYTLLYGEILKINLNSEIVLRKLILAIYVVVAVKSWEGVSFGFVPQTLFNVRIFYRFV